MDVGSRGCGEHGTQQTPVLPGVDCLAKTIGPALLSVVGDFSSFHAHLELALTNPNPIQPRLKNFNFFRRRYARSVHCRNPSSIFHQPPWWCSRGCLGTRRRWPGPPHHQHCRTHHHHHHRHHNHQHHPFPSSSSNNNKNKEKATSSRGGRCGSSGSSWAGRPSSTGRS